MRDKRIEKLQREDLTAPPIATETAGSDAARNLKKQLDEALRPAPGKGCSLPFAGAAPPPDHPTRSGRPRCSSVPASPRSSSSCTPRWACRWARSPACCGRGSAWRSPPAASFICCIEPPATPRRSYRELCRQVRNAPVVTPDETGWRVGVKSHWLWTFVTPETTVYAICPGRGFADAATVLGTDYAGVLVRDGLRVYRRYKGSLHQSCLNHLLQRCKKLEQKAPLQVRGARWSRPFSRSGLDLRDRCRNGELTRHGLGSLRGRLEARHAVAVADSTANTPRRGSAPVDKVGTPAGRSRSTPSAGSGMDRRLNPRAPGTSVTLRRDARPDRLPPAVVRTGVAAGELVGPFADETTAVQTAAVCNRRRPSGHVPRSGPERRNHQRPRRRSLVAGGVVSSSGLPAKRGLAPRHSRRHQPDRRAPGLRLDR